MVSTQAFTAWFKAQGGQLHPDVEFAHSPGYGLHLRVKPDASIPHLQKNTTVVACPHSLTLSALDAQPAPDALSSAHTGSQDARLMREEFVLPREVRLRARPQCVATFWLAVQYLLAEQSAWAPYIRLLPRPPREDGEEVEQGGGGLEVGVVDTAVWWGAEERSWVQGTNLEKGVRDLETSWLVEWETWSPVVVAWAEEMGLPGLNWTLFKWAVSIYGSRAFSSAVLSFVKSSPDARWRVLQSYDPHALLYPGVDFLNHSTQTRNCWFCDEQCFAIVCNDEPGPGEQVWNSYGMKDNGSLLLSFGFALPDNPRDAFALKLPATRDPPFIEAIRQQQSPSQEQYQSPASLLRFAASADLKSAGILPSTPGETIALNDSETLLSHDPDNNVHYLRSPSELSALSHSRSSKPNPGYPVLASTSTDHLHGFPISLLNNLAARLANTREAACASLEPRSYSEEKLWMQLGRRNLAALSVLLLGRLRLEISRFEALDWTPLELDMDNDPAEIADAEFQTQETEASGKKKAKARLDDGLEKRTSCLKRRRRQNVLIYIESQMKVLRENFDLLRDWVFRTFAGLRLEVSSSDSLEGETRKNGVAHAHNHIITVPQAVELLRRLEPAVADEFVAGVLMMLEDEELDLAEGNDEAGWWDYVRAMRGGLTERDEEDVLVLWLGTVFAVLYEDESPKQLNDEARRVLDEYCSFWTKWYGVHMAATTGISENRAGVGQVEGQDEDESIETMALVMQEEVGKIGADLDGLRTWTAGCWTGSLEFLKGCVSAVREESVSVMIGVEEYDIFEQAERHGESILVSLRGVQPVFDAEEDSRRIIGLCLPELAS